MAQKRMICDNYVDTVTFSEMSASARLLYFYLHCASDEDGCCSGAKVLKSAKLRNSALDELITNGYAIPLVNTPPKERIVYLTDWHNLNRYKHELNTAPMYRTQLVQTIPDIQNALFKAKNDPVFAPSIGKYSVGKSSIGESSVVEVSQDKVSTAELSTGNVSIDNESIDKPSTNNVNTYSHDNNIPTLDLVINELMSTYYLTTTEAQEVANAFITYNIGKEWKGLRSKSWIMLLNQFIGCDKRYTPEKIESRRTEAQERAEEIRRAESERIERERQEEEERKLYRQDNLIVNSVNDIVEYIKSDKYFIRDIDLTSCLHHYLCNTHTITKSDIAEMYEAGMLGCEANGLYFDYSVIGESQGRIKEIAEKIGDDIYYERWREEPIKADKPIIDTYDYYGEALPFS